MARTKQKKKDEQVTPDREASEHQSRVNSGQRVENEQDKESSSAPPQMEMGNSSEPGQQIEIPESSEEPSEAEQEKSKWIFPDKRKCPRCGSIDTRAYHTDVKNGRQYRKCNRGHCRYRYSVDGRRIDA